MGEFRITESYYRLMDIIWRNEPTTLRILVALCADELGWKRTTVTTVLKKLCDEGYCAYDGKTITSLVSRADLERADSAGIISSRFGNSLPRFITSFVEQQPLTGSEVDEIIAILEKQRDRCKNGEE